MMKETDDLSLVSEVTVSHNRAAFDRLVVRYQSPIRRFFLHQTLGDEQLSDDLAQDTFIKAYVNIDKFRAHHRPERRELRAEQPGGGFMDQTDSCADP